MWPMPEYRRCQHCSTLQDVTSVASRTWQQWQCDVCGSWEDWPNVDDRPAIEDDEDTDE